MSKSKAIKYLKNLPKYKLPDDFDKKLFDKINKLKPKYMTKEEVIKRKELLLKEIANLDEIIYDKKPEEVLLELINGCTLKFDFEKHPDTIFLFKNGECLFKLNFKNKVLWCNYDKVWSILGKIFDGNYNKTKDLIKGVVETHFGIKGLIIRYSMECL